MKMKKILISTLVLAMMVMLGGFVYAENQTIPASVNFEDFDPFISHGDPMEEYGGRIVYLISCNMVLKPKSKIHLSRLCDSATTNVKYYMNNSESDIKKGPDYINTVEDETFYPASKRIANSYIGGKVNYKVSSDFQTKKSNGEKVYKETPTTFQPVVIISSRTQEVDLGVATPISVPTGDQSQPNWVGFSDAIEGCEGIRVAWTYRFGTLPDNVSGISRVATKKVDVVGGLNAATFTDAVNEGQIFYTTTQTTNLNDSQMAIAKRAKKLIMEYNENPGACDESTGETLISDGWQRIDAEHGELLKIVTEDGVEKLQYPKFINAWGRIVAVLEVPTADDCRPVRRTIVKARIGTKYPGFEFKNMEEGDVLKIYTVNGKKIREVSSGTPDGFVWDGRKDNGDWAKSGIYVYQLKHDGKLVSGTIVFVY